MSVRTSPRILPVKKQGVVEAFSGRDIERIMILGPVRDTVVQSDHSIKTCIFRGAKHDPENGSKLWQLSPSIFFTARVKGVTFHDVYPAPRDSYNSDAPLLVRFQINIITTVRRSPTRENILLLFSHNSEKNVTDE